MHLTKYMFFDLIDLFILNYHCIFQHYVMINIMTLSRYIFTLILDCIVSKLPKIYRQVCTLKASWEIFLLIKMIENKSVNE